MTSSGKKIDCEPPEPVVSGVCSGSVKPGQPICGKTVMERGKVEVSFSASNSCSRLKGGREE